MAMTVRSVRLSYEWRLSHLSGHTKGDRNPAEAASWCAGHRYRPEGPALWKKLCC